MLLNETGEKIHPQDSLSLVSSNLIIAIPRTPPLPAVSNLTECILIDHSHKN